MNEFKPMASKASFPKPSATVRPHSNNFLLLTFLLSTLSLCSSSEETLIVDRLEGLTSTAQPQPNRHLVEKEGDVSLLVVRVIGLDRSPSMDKDALFKSIFIKEASARQQYNKCSAGKLNIVPTDKGVLEVRINMNVNGANVADVVSAVDDAGLAQLTGVTSFRSFADLTMFVIPQGTKRFGDSLWSGYAVTNGKASFLNDSKANYLGVQMHELGHNFGLDHANALNDPSGDLTSHMSRALLKDDFPIKCFNAQNHWIMGWFRGRSITVDPQEPVKLKILGFVDYTKAVQGDDNVVAKVGENLYLQFNRAKLHNIDTEEAPDKLVIIIDRGGSQGTILVAALDNNNKLYKLPNFEGSGRQLNVEVCRTVMGGTDSDIDWMEVSIGYGASVCGDQLATDPDPVPPPTTESGSSLLGGISVPKSRPSFTLLAVNSPSQTRPMPAANSAPQPSPSPPSIPRPTTSSHQFDHRFAPPNSESTTALFGQVAGRYNDRDGQGGSVASPPSIVADRMNNFPEEVPEEQSAGTVTFNNLSLYTMVAVATFAALLR
jgi:hypothetical protein